MKPTTRWTCIALLCVLFAVPLLAASKPAVSAARAEDRPVVGTQLASTLSQITGIAISPMLGVSALGAYKWVRAETPEEKANLPWYAQPMYWITGLLIVGAVALKDAAGTSLPPGWKKPLDVAETLENKLSGLVAAGAVIPFTLDTLTSVLGGGGGGAELQQASGLAMIQFGAIDFQPILNVLLAPFAIAVFLFVWLTSHAINVLILLSPWGVVDAALKSLRMSVLGLLVVTPHINPWLGVACSLVVIVVSYLLAGWAFRLTTYGAVFCWDFFTFRRNRFVPDATENKVFAGKGVDKTPLRTYGRIARTPEGKLRFRYRPWLVLPEKQVELPDQPLAVGRGLFYPTIEAKIGEEERTIILLPPRYKGHEAEFARACGIDELTDVGLRRAWGVVVELFGFNSRRRVKLAATGAAGG